MSATARRKDGFENAFFFHIGKVCTPTIKQAIKPHTIIFKYYNPATHHAGCVWGGKLSLGKYYNKLAKNGDRNIFIAKIVKKLYEKGKDILILSDRISQLWSLHAWLKTGGVPESDIGIFTGKQKIGLDRKIILATYGSAGIGADIPRLSAIVMATPRADVEQPVGRVLRKEMAEPQVIIDIVDVASHIMVGWGYARLKYYQKISSRINTIERRIE